MKFEETADPSGKKWAKRGAIAGGADHIVVGRPVTEAADPAAVAEQIVADITSARELVGKKNRKP